MKSSVLAVLGTVMSLVIGFFSLRSAPTEIESPVPEAIYQAPPITDQHRLEWMRQAVEQLTPEHRLHLSAEQQEVFQACGVQLQRAAYAYKVTQAQEAQADLNRWQAEVDRWESHVHAAASAELAAP